MFLEGNLIAETPIYRGNARKTLFTRDGDGEQRLVSLAGEISGTASYLMDAFIGQARRGDNIGLINEQWRRLYGEKMPDNLITQVNCRLKKESYPSDNFFGVRMGIKLDEDRWAAEANANYKMETIFRNAVFDFKMRVNDNILKRDGNAAKLYYLLRELQEGRFWFGAGKSKGLGRVRLEMDLPSPAPEPLPNISSGANHLKITLTFDALNPVLVGWNWGKVDPDQPEFVAVEGRILVEAMRGLPDPIRDRLKMVIGGPVLSPEDWKIKLSQHMPRIVAVWLQERSTGERDIWTLSEQALKKLGKGRYGLAKSAINAVKPLCDKPFRSKDAAEEAFVEALGNKANMAGRVVDALEHERREVEQFDEEAWQQVAESTGMDPALSDALAENIDDESELTRILTDACIEVLPQLYQMVDQQVHLQQSDTWVDEEIDVRREHLQIKQMLFDGKINERQWGDPNRPPEGISTAAWQGFLADHRGVKFKYMMNRRNLRKSINNDRNFIAFLETYRDRARQELAQPHHIDFRGGGPHGRTVSRKYGKPYDTVFMRMLSWSPSQEGDGSWETYIPGSTIKGAFRKRATQVLKTLWGETRQTTQVLERLFGAQGKRGAIFFSDAYLADPLDPHRAWCSMDGVKMNSKTGKPVEAAKRDYLFAYGGNLVFQLRLDIQDLSVHDLEAISVLLHMLNDFQRGDIPLGGEKTSGFGWVEADVAEVTWLTGSSGSDAVTETLFGNPEFTRDGVWQRMTLKDEDAEQALGVIDPLTAEQSVDKPPRARGGFISHRAFGGHCGMLFVEAEVLSPIHIQESGEPSHRARLDDGIVNGWDFFSMAPPEAEMRPDDRVYVLPSQSLKGLLRHTYTIASDSSESSGGLSRLNPVDSLFGFVGPGQNQALMARLSVDFGFFDDPELGWFKVPYPYTGWQYVERADEWKFVEGSSVPQLRIADRWRLFPHAPMAPIVERLDGFEPDDVQANYCRAILPGARARFGVRFWNLQDEELQRLLWIIALEPTMAHKMGKSRYLGFGSLRFHILPESYLIDWNKRYAVKSEDAWQEPIPVEGWLNPDVIAYYDDLRKALNAESI
jgi:CRISPR/Cas system CSM-associated protein Csm3 (group 7 of RAMP superfamily)